MLFFRKESWRSKVVIQRPYFKQKSRQRDRSSLRSQRNRSSGSRRYSEIHLIQNESFASGKKICRLAWLRKRKIRWLRFNFLIRLVSRERDLLRLAWFFKRFFLQQSQSGHKVIRQGAYEKVSWFFDAKHLAYPRIALIWAGF